MLFINAGSRFGGASIFCLYKNLPCTGNNRINTRAMKKWFFYFALAGFLSGLTVHVLSVAGFDVKERIPFVWVLHIGIFLIWLPVILELRKNEELRSLQDSGSIRSLNPKVMFSILFKNTPRWLIILIICCFVYAVINFVLFIISGPGNVEMRNGQYTLESNGKTIAVLTESRYHYYRSQQLRGFSGHWIAFYAAVLGILYPMIFGSKKRNKEQQP